MTDLPPITPRQEEVLFLLAKRAYAGPDGKQQRVKMSVRQIGAVLGVSSPSTVHEMLRMLEVKGYIRRIRTAAMTNHWREIVILHPVAVAR